MSRVRCDVSMCNLKAQIMTLRMSDIVLYDETADQSNYSIYYFGDSPNNKKITVRIESSYNFPKGLRLKLALRAVKNINGIITNVSRIKTFITLSEAQNVIYFDIIGDIPLPNNIAYIPTIISSDVPYMQISDITDYYFTFHIKCNSARTCIAFPLNARYLNDKAICDIRCEQLDCVTEPDDTHTIEIYCNYDTPEQFSLYCSTPHCVTHCQAPRPKIVYYDPANGAATREIPCEKCN